MPPISANIVNSQPDQIKINTCIWINASVTLLSKYSCNDLLLRVAFQLLSESMKS